MGDMGISGEAHPVLEAVRRAVKLMVDRSRDMDVFARESPEPLRSEARRLSEKDAAFARTLREAFPEAFTEPRPAPTGGEGQGGG